MIGGVLLILITWGACALTLVGVGSCILRWFNREFALIHAFWIGLAVSVVILQLWNLFEPINIVADLLIAIVGSAGIVWSRSNVLRKVGEIGNIGTFILFLYFLIVLSLAIRAVGPCDHFDTGLYGATAVRWATTYPVVPGLAKLHGRLGFNSSVTLCTAALSQGIWRSAGHHLFAGLLVSGFWATIGPGLGRVLRGTSTSATDWFHSILFVPAIFWTTQAHLVGTMTDLPASLTCVVAVGMLFAELEDSRTTIWTEDHRIASVVGTTLLALATTFKLSVAVFAASSWVLWVSWLYFRNLPGKSYLKFVVASCALSTTLIAPWLIRGILLSGYPFYPQTLFSFGVDWRVSVEACNWELAWIRSWGRKPWVDLADTRGFAWFAPWFHTNILAREAFQVPLVLSLLGGVGTVVSSRRLRFANGKLEPWLWLFVPSFVALLIWFLQSPAPRFAEAAIWTMAAVLATSAIVRITSTVRGGWLSRAFGILIIVTGAWCIAPHRLWTHVYKPLLTSYSPLEMPKAEVQPIATTSGLIVFWRMDGQQCWDAPLPCTPYFDKTLRLRRPGNLRMGFDSDWPVNESDLANTWARPVCSVSDTECLTRRNDINNKDHGSE